MQSFACHLSRLRAAHSIYCASPLRMRENCSVGGHFTKRVTDHVTPRVCIAVFPVTQPMRSCPSRAVAPVQPMRSRPSRDVAPVQPMRSCPELSLSRSPLTVTRAATHHVSRCGETKRERGENHYEWGRGVAGYGKRSRRCAAGRGLQVVMDRGAKRRRAGGTFISGTGDGIPGALPCSQPMFDNTPRNGWGGRGGRRHSLKQQWLGTARSPAPGRPSRAETGRDHPVRRTLSTHRLHY